MNSGFEGEMPQDTGRSLMLRAGLDPRPWHSRCPASWKAPPTASGVTALLPEPLKRRRTKGQTSCLQTPPQTEGLTERVNLGVCTCAEPVQALAPSPGSALRRLCSVAWEVGGTRGGHH